jgi:hypothetical protein
MGEQVHVAFATVVPPGDIVDHPYPAPHQPPTLTWRSPADQLWHSSEVNGKPSSNGIIPKA